VNTASEGDYFRRIHTDARCTPEDRGRLLILKADTAGVSAVFEEIVFHPISSFADLPEVLRELSGLPISACRKVQGDGECLILRAEPDIVGQDLLREDLKEPVLRFLKEAGGRKDILAGLDAVSFFCGVPYREESGKNRAWMVRADLAAVKLEIREGRIWDCHGVCGSVTDWLNIWIFLSSRSVPISGILPISAISAAGTVICLRKMRGNPAFP
jgi:hypothetical protein